MVSCVQQTFAVVFQRFRPTEKGEKGGATKVTGLSEKGVLGQVKKVRWRAGSSGKGEMKSGAE